MKMRRVVEWLFFFICCNALLYSSSGETGFVSSKAATSQDLKPLMKEKQLKNVFKSQRTSFKGLQEALEVGKEKKLLGIHNQNKKGKGSYGGGDLRPRSKKSGSNPLLLKSSSFHSTLLLRYVILGFLPTMFFF